ncbi:MAG: hypothetical protein A2W99_04245 [Bacteroidetes bacterium GWF2_33_16]|nr:MAG: hypothetical protein A2X00_16765 [Bacteroidetes bacterium GWE2_32_14]OFY05882.1 MAG: hypothetical protein A2W99_04245 [Bacteroidetes bacterium GWF2_33_16]
MGDNNLYDKLKDILKKTGGKYAILEDQVDVDLQLKFFEISNSLRKDKRDIKDIIQDVALLYDSKIDIEQKKKILAELSDSDSVEAYRELEKYVKLTDSELKQWALLAFQHCRIGLESKLLDEHKVFISTGLGGKDDKLRYFIAFKNKSGLGFSETQCKVIDNEFGFIFKKNNCEIEEIKYLDQYLAMIIIMPVDCELGRIVASAINEVNLYGDFLQIDYLITNVKMLEKNDIDFYFNKENKK